MLRRAQPGWRRPTCGAGPAPSVPAVCTPAGCVGWSGRRSLVRGPQPDHRLWRTGVRRDVTRERRGERSEVMAAKKRVKKAKKAAKKSKKK